MGSQLEVERHRVRNSINTDPTLMTSAIKKMPSLTPMTITCGDKTFTVSDLRPVDARPESIMMKEIT